MLLLDLKKLLVARSTIRPVLCVIFVFVPPNMFKPATSCVYLSQLGMGPIVQQLSFVGVQKNTCCLFIIMYIIRLVVFSIKLLYNFIPYIAFHVMWHWFIVDAAVRRHIVVIFYVIWSLIKGCSIIKHITFQKKMHSK